jgi:hypothetical protein
MAPAGNRISQPWRPVRVHLTHEALAVGGVGVNPIGMEPLRPAARREPVHDRARFECKC